MDYRIGPDDELPGDAVVIRTGTMTDKTFLDNDTLIERKLGMHGVCVHSDPTMTEEQVAWAMRVKGRSINVTTAGLIRDGGFRIVRTPDDPGGPTSAMMLFDGPFNPQIGDRIRACFPNERKPNPAFGKSPIYTDPGGESDSGR